MHAVWRIFQCQNLEFSVRRSFVLAIFRHTLDRTRRSVYYRRYSLTLKFAFHLYIYTSSLRSSGKYKRSLSRVSCVECVIAIVPRKVHKWYANSMMALAENRDGPRVMFSAVTTYSPSHIETWLLDRDESRSRLTEVLRSLDTPSIRYSFSAIAFFL